MNGIGWAIEQMESGQKVAREGWNGAGMFIFLVPGSTFQVSRPPLLGIYPEGTEIRYQPHVDMRTPQGTVVPWNASQSDLLAEDWKIVEGDAATLVVTVAAPEVAPSDAAPVAVPVPDDGAASASLVEAPAEPTSTEGTVAA
jgi:Protein of unknown function (DUF2829)